MSRHFSGPVGLDFRLNIGPAAGVVHDIKLPAIGLRRGSDSRSHPIAVGFAAVLD